MKRPTAKFNGKPVVDLISPVQEQLRQALAMINTLTLEGTSPEDRQHARRRFGGMFAYLHHRDDIKQIDNYYRIIPVDLSEGGIGFIHGTFAYPGMQYSIILQKRDAEEDYIEVPGKITRCQLITGRIHSVGLAFDCQIDITPYVKADATDSASNAA